MSRSRVRRPWGAMAIAGALIVSACGGDDDDASDATDAGGGTEEGTGTTGFPQPEGEPDLDATFIYGYPITVSRLDPHRASISQDATTLFPVYDRLVHLSPTGELIPALA